MDNDTKNNLNEIFKDKNISGLFAVIYTVVSLLKILEGKEGNTNE